MACIVLSDGAGSRSKSEIGADVVVRAASRLFLKNFDKIYTMCNDSEELACKHILNRLLLSLKRAATQHSCELPDLASTLLFVAQKGKRYVAGHIGDGLIVRFINGEAKTLSPPDNGEFANMTFFVTDSHGVERFRLFHGEIEPGYSGYMIMSDGCAESLYSKNTGALAPAASKLLSWNQDLSRKKMKEVIAKNLESHFSQISSDDCSMALMSIIECN